MFSVSGVMPFGQAELHLGYDRSKLSVDGGEGSFSTTVEQIKATLPVQPVQADRAVRTVSRLNNKDATRLTLSGAAGLTTAGDKSKGFEIGVRHFF